ncbi:AAA family ATPase [Bacillus sp. FSL E2-8887]|uniref:AAA family ATPase n=1 Tax=Bacillus sp. FSL E2-8887 TaxID=2954599 RepID=UPI0030F935D2
MRVECIRVKNFRSIVDSGNFYLHNNMTVLAGKNESGKSTILKALEFFSTGVFSEDDIPEKFQNMDIGKMDDILEVTVNLKFTYEEIIENLLPTQWVLPFYEDTLDLTIKKSFGGYGKNLITEIDGKLIRAIFGVRFNNIKDNFINLLHNLELVEKYFSYDFEELKSYADIKPFSNSRNLRNIYYELHNANLHVEFINNNESIEAFAIEAIEDFLSLSRKLEGFIEDVLEDLYGLYIHFEPKFILFDSFDDILPDVVNYKDDKIKIVERFYKVANINPVDLFQAKGFNRKKMTRKFSTDFTEEFSSYYNQNKMRLECSLDGDDLYFSVYDDNNNLPFRPGQRSRGFQWFLSFFLTLKAEKSNNCVLLIDEPGLYLHAKAQNDVLQVLDNISNYHQVIMTTHSPYLIDPSRLEKLRLVLKNDDGSTYIENKIHKGADKDTLTPVITSIGLDLNKDLIFSRNGINILVEGISDYFYLEALKKYIKIPDVDTDKFRFIPNVGATQIPNLAALLIGWGLDFLVILDNDKEGERVQKTLLDKLAVDQDKIIFVSNVKNFAIEDMFAKEDFSKFILLEDIEVDNQKSNSKLANSFGKVLLAKRFNELCNSSDLDLNQETINNFTELFTKLSFVTFNNPVLLSNID